MANPVPNPATVDLAGDSGDAASMVNLSPIIALRTRDLVALGVHTDALCALRESGRIVELRRGLYGVAEVGEAEHPDLAVAAARAPNAALVNLTYPIVYIFICPPSFELAVFGL